MWFPKMGGQICIKGTACRLGIYSGISHQQLVYFDAQQLTENIWEITESFEFVLFNQLCAILLL